MKHENGFAREEQDCMRMISELSSMIFSYI